MEVLEENSLAGPFRGICISGPTVVSAKALTCGILSLWARLCDRERTGQRRGEGKGPPTSTWSVFCLGGAGTVQGCTLKACLLPGSYKRTNSSLISGYFELYIVGYVAISGSNNKDMDLL